ncbi:hypothetical protein EPUS_03766 [Endocarpon pusillum Z07020]|uniref:RING and UBP finger domain protein n=1 Tax=Endocarpon pusillum (strain Z07020 / HMAS-L-300199) TaxID=1263415 RepID=U1G8Y3_ENDPU|nr:uncharacterized protein EPUS_03766 [Endocarpon pusillum Z07020]ERF68448.1 hypothetical protein EPUS_03766 [Endocarpon pusillum Z07020]
MPEFFFHVSIELFADVQSTAPQVDKAIVAWPSGSQALSPFLSSKRERSVHSVRSTNSSVGAYHPSGISQPSVHKKASSGVRVDLSPNDSPKTPSGNPRTASDDKRLDHIYIESTNTLTRKLKLDKMDDDNHISKGIGISANGLLTKGRYEPLDQHVTDSIWGIVHLYRDAEETPGLYGDSLLSKPNNPWYSGTPKESKGTVHPPANDQDCTTLCILAVPSYLAPPDFLGFVGEETRDQVSHFRMIRTSRANRYMVLIKFRDGKMARTWQKAWNGKVFNSMEPETCHVVFVKSVEITITTPSSPDTFPDMKNDPFTSPHAHTSSTLGSSKPLAPRTPSLVELPTCPVCLERMDETTGLLTILCQHVFHCTCLQKWSGGGCPVCRYTHDDFSSRPRLCGKSGKKDSYGDSYEDEPIGCETCHIEANLWQCLICGRIGCGRYEAKHAFSHYEETGHSFAMDMESKRVWDYTGDGYVHRIIQNSTDGLGGKLVELPGSRHNETALAPSSEQDEIDSISREKMEGLSLEYTHLLTSQLESQRVYFEEQVERAADKAAKASAAASAALATAAALKTKYDDLARDAVPALEREKTRLETRAAKFEDMARKMEKEYREEQAMNERLMERIAHLGKEIEGLQGEKRELEEQNRDLSFFISGQERLRDAGEEVVEGTVSVPDPIPVGGAGRKKGNGKGRR